MKNEKLCISEILENLFKRSVRIDESYQIRAGHSENFTKKIYVQKSRSRDL